MSYESYKWKGGDLITVNQMNRIEQGVLEMNEAYVPTVWQTGDTVTAEKLNKIEQGIAEGGGGGGGDLTTAEVTIISESTIDAEAYLPVALDIPDVESPDAEGRVFIPFGETYVYNAILYKGVCFFELKTEEVVIKSVDGDVGETDISVAMIEGNCTITIGDAY